MTKPVCVLIAGGGTGGHLFPGLALAQQLALRGATVFFVGTQKGIEATAVPQAGFPIDFIDIAGLKRQGFGPTVRALLKLPVAFFQTLRLLLRLRPHIVVGVGGYASGPAVLLAFCLRIPTVILEQNSIPGLTNRILSRVARQVFAAFPQTRSFFPAHKVALLGNPIRAQIVEAAGRKTLSQAGPVNLLVLGGSLGAKAVNTLVFEALILLQKHPELAPLGGRLRVRHQTGAADFADVKARYENMPGLAVDVVPFIADMAGAYAEADLMVGRAGATTLAELTAMGLPALLIPFPFAADDHQTHNARYLADQGAAHLLPQADTTPEKLAQVLAHLLCRRAELSAMAESSRKLGRPGAAGEIAGVLLNCVNRGLHR